MIVGICLIKLHLQNTLLELTVVNDTDVFDTDIVGGKDRSNRSDSSGFINQVAEQLVNRADRTAVGDIEGIAVFLGRTEKFFDLLRMAFRNGISCLLQSFNISINQL